MVMTCIKERLQVAYDNIAFYGNRTWENESYLYRRMNQELYTKENRVTESYWLGSSRPKTVQDVIPNSRLAQYYNFEYNVSRELSYRPCLNTDVSFHYPCLYRSSTLSEPWMLPEVEELFVMLTCLHTFNYIYYKKLNDVTNLDVLEAGGVDLCQSPRDFHEVNPFYEEMFDRTPGGTTISFTERVPDEDVLTPPLYKVNTFDEMLMKMKLRFGNIRHVWSNQCGLGFPDRIINIFKSPLKSTFTRENHHLEGHNLDTFNPIQSGKDAKRTRNVQEIRHLQHLADSLKMLHSTINVKRNLKINRNVSFESSTPPRSIHEEGSPPVRRLYSDVVQGVSNMVNNKLCFLKTDYFSEYTHSTPNTSSIRNSSCLSISSYTNLTTPDISPQSANNLKFNQMKNNICLPSPPTMRLINDTSTISTLEDETSAKHTTMPAQQIPDVSIAHKQTTSTASIVATSDNNTLHSNCSVVTTNASNNTLTGTEFSFYPQSNVNPSYRKNIPTHATYPTNIFYNSYSCTPANNNLYCTSYCTNSNAFPNCSYNPYGNHQVSSFRGVPSSPGNPVNRPFHQTSNPHPNSWFIQQYSTAATSNRVAPNVYTNGGSAQNYPTPPFVLMPPGTPTLAKSTATTQTATAPRWSTAAAAASSHYTRTTHPPFTVNPTNNTALWTPGGTANIYRTNSNQQLHRPQLPLLMSQPPPPPPPSSDVTAQLLQMGTVDMMQRQRKARKAVLTSRVPSALQKDTAVKTIVLNRNKGINEINMPPVMGKHSIDRMGTAIDYKLMVRKPDGVREFINGSKGVGGLPAVATSRSQELERQALSEYQSTASEETLLYGQIEREAVEQYESSSENWHRPPSESIYDVGGQYSNQYETAPVA